MFYKFVIGLVFVLVLMAAGGTYSSRSMKDSVNDKAIQTQTVILDKALIAWYKNHAELPAQLSEEVFTMMGLSGLETENWQYTRNSNGRQYTLRAQLSYGSWESPYSGTLLPELPKNEDEDI